MKKKNFIIGGAAALCAIASVGTSFALYLVKPGAIEGNISVSTGADINYQISNVNVTGGTLTPTNTTNTFNFNIHGVKNSASVFQQPFVLAKLTITITPDENHKTLTDYLTAAAVVDYTDGKYYAGTAGLNSITFSKPDDNGVITGSLTTFIYVGTSDTWKATPDNKEGLAPDHNPVTLTVDLQKDLDDKMFVTELAEATYKVDISLTNDETYEYAYVVGEMNGWTDGDDAYAMVKNINADAKTGDEWVWFGELPDGTGLKAKKGDTWSADPDTVVTIPEGKRMSAVYWKEGGQATISYEDLPTTGTDTQA